MGRVNEYAVFSRSLACGNIGIRPFGKDSFILTLHSSISGYRMCYLSLKRAKTPTSSSATA